LSFTTQGGTDVAGWIGLAGYASTNRLLLSNSNQRFWANIGSSTLKKKESLTFDYALLNTTKITRDSSGDVYIKFNNDTPISCFNTTSTLTFNHICKAYDKYFKGYLLGYSIGTETWDLSEGSGDTLTGSNGTKHILKSNVSISSMWVNLPSEQASIQVYNEGVGGNNVVNLWNRTSDVSEHNPDHIFVWVGTNDALNSGKILDSLVYRDSLISLIEKLQTENPSATISLLNIIPCTDSLLKITHNYTSIYGDESTFDLNDDVISGFNSMIDYVSIVMSVQVLDVNSLIASNLSTISDGTHINSTGYSLVAQLCETVCDRKLVIVSFGDSLTNGSNAGGGNDYPTKLEQLLNN